MEGTSHLINNITTGTNYYNKHSNFGEHAVWYHSYNNSSGGLSAESFTVETAKMGLCQDLSSPATSRSYALFIRLPGGNIANYQSSDNLKVDIYIAEDYVGNNHKKCCSDVNCISPSAALPAWSECHYDYRLFSKPYKTFYFSKAIGSNNQTASYWHVLNLKNDIDYKNPGKYIEEINAIATGPEYFKYEYSDKYVK